MVRHAGFVPKHQEVSLSDAADLSTILPIFGAESADRLAEWREAIVRSVLADADSGAAQSWLDLATHVWETLGSASQHGVALHAEAPVAASAGGPAASIDLSGFGIPAPGATTFGTALVQLALAAPDRLLEHQIPVGESAAHDVQQDAIRADSVSAAAGSGVGTPANVETLHIPEILGLPLGFEPLSLTFG